MTSISLDAQLDIPRSVAECSLVQYCILAVDHVKV